MLLLLLADVVHFARIIALFALAAGLFLLFRFFWRVLSLSKMTFWEEALYWLIWVFSVAATAFYFLVTLLFGLTPINGF